MLIASLRAGLCTPGFVMIHWRNQNAMLFSMIVTITSWAPVRALSTPAIIPISPPPTAAPSSAAIRCSTGGSGRAKPTSAPPMQPKITCPWPPMLNRPLRNASATDSPVKINGAV